jgi:hypothetical protein
MDPRSQGRRQGPALDTAVAGKIPVDNDLSGWFDLQASQ